MTDRPRDSPVPERVLSPIAGLARVKETIFGPRCEDLNLVVGLGSGVDLGIDIETLTIRTFLISVDT